MAASEHWHAASDGKQLFYRRWLPDGPVKAVVQLVHGLAEHSARYDALAGALTAQGWAVYADDHRGHGKTGDAVGELGFFDGGVARVKQDLVELMAAFKAAHPRLPYALIGHSMGSFFVQALMQSHGAELTAAVLSGTTGKPPPLAYVGLGIARLELWRKGPRGTSAIARALTFDAFNKPFQKDGPTRFEWLSRDRAIVDRYAADPFCGFDASNALWLGIIELLFANAKPEGRAQVPKSLPVWIVSGTEDMAGERMKGPTELYLGYQRAGLTDVKVRFFKDGRHEIFNETNRAEVHAALVEWLKEKLHT